MQQWISTQGLLKCKRNTVELRGRGPSEGSEQQSLFQGHFAGLLFLPPLFTPSNSFQLLLYSRTPDYLLSSPRFCSWLLSLSQLSSSRKPFPLSYTAFLSPFLPSFLPPSLLPPRSFNLRFEDYKSFTSLARPTPGQFSPFLLLLSSSSPMPCCQLLPPPPRQERMG